MNSQGDFIETQDTAEDPPFNGEELQTMLALAKQGIRQITQIQKTGLGWT